jgi:hypothetical protein
MSRGKWHVLCTYSHQPSNNARVALAPPWAPPGTGAFVKSECGAPRLHQNALSHWSSIPPTQVRSDEMMRVTQGRVVRKGGLAAKDSLQLELLSP